MAIASIGRNTSSFCGNITQGGELADTFADEQRNKEKRREQGNNTSEPEQDCICLPCHGCSILLSVKDREDVSD